MKNEKKPNLYEVDEEHYQYLKEALLHVSLPNFKQFLVQEPHLVGKNKIEILISHINQGSLKLMSKKERINRILDEE